MGSSKIYVHIRDEEIENIPGNFDRTTSFAVISHVFLVYEEVFSSDDEDEDEDSKWFDINVTEDHLGDFHFR